MKHLTLYLIAVIGVVLFSCTKDTMEPVVTVKSTTPGDTVSFATAIYPVFTKYSCTSCHGGTAGLTFTKPASEVVADLISKGSVVTGKSADSDFYGYFKDGKSHNGKSMTAQEVSDIKDWINFGALDN